MRLPAMSLRPSQLDWESRVQRRRGFLLLNSRFRTRGAGCQRQALPGLGQRQVRVGNDEHGFTLVELVVYMTLAVMFTILVFSFMFDFWGSAATLENDSETFVTRQDAGDSLRDRLNAAAHLISQNSIGDAHTLVGDPSDSTGTYWEIIHAIPGTTSMPGSGSYAPVIYYESPSIDSSKNYIMNGSQPYDDEFVLYLNGSTKQLLLRTLVNPSASGDRLKTSCPAASASSTCPADTIIASDVTSVSARYFSRSGNTIDYTSVVDPVTGLPIGPDFPSVEVVELTLNLGRKSTVNGSQSTLNETIVRVALRNQ